MLASQTDYLITKGNQVEKLRPKMPYGHGRGQVSENTEYRNEYPAKDGLASDQLRHPDHVNFGKNRFLKTTNGAFHKDTRNDPIVKQDFDKTNLLKNEIKDISKQGHVLQTKEEHNGKYDRPIVHGENTPKPDAWIRGKNEKKNLEFKDKTANKDFFPGHHGKSADIQKERYDNLKPAKEIPIHDRTNYRLKHGGKTPDIKADKEFFDHNHTKGKHGHKFLQNPDAEKVTAYQKQFNDTQKVGDFQGNHVGKDDKTRDFLYQYHAGYYHV